MALDALIEMENVTLDFGGGAGIFDISLSLPAGSILGMIGPSGSGKTTLVRTLTGLYRPNSGRVRVFDCDPLDFSEQEKVRIGYIPQQMILYNHLTVEENLYIIGGMYGLPHRQRKARIEDLLSFVEMEEARRKPAAKLSGGMRRRLMLAAALLHNPTLIFADEPTAGLDPLLRASIWQTFAQLKQTGHTLVVTTQYIGEAANCDCVALMRKGRIVTLDTPMGLRRQAAGGEIIALHVPGEQVYAALQLATEFPRTNKAEVIDAESGEIHVTVDHAGRDLPALLAALKEIAGIVPLSAEPRLLPFDEVFVRLIQRTNVE